ncbi:MAG: phosphatase PAP2 family protein [Bacteriovorax sp.]
MSELFSQINEIDRKVTLAVKKWRNDFMTTFMRAFTESARGYAWAIYALALNLLAMGNRNLFVNQTALLRAMFGPLLGWGVGNIFKKLIKRKRPFQSLDDFLALTHSPINDSFPSLHALTSTSFFAGLFLYHHPFAPWVLVWALMVGFSRLYLGVHYLSDLLGGIFLGVLCGGLIFLFN